MPGILVHNISADRILEKCSEEIKAIVNQNKTAYLAGAQATDCFYFYKYKILFSGWRTKMYGWATHRYRPKWFLKDMATYLKEHYSDTLFAYVMGYLSHYVVDKNVHPLVLRDAPKLRAHTIIEQELEVLYAVRSGVDPFSYSREQYLRNSALDEGFQIGRMHKWLLENVYRKVIRMDEAAYSKSFADWAVAFRNIDNPTKKERKAILRRNRVTSFDLDCFLLKQPEEIPDRERFDEYFEALDRSEDDGVKHLELIADYVKGRAGIESLDENLENISMQGCVVTPIEKKISLMDKFLSYRINK